MHNYIWRYFTLYNFIEDILSDIEITHYIVSFKITAWKSQIDHFHKNQDIPVSWCAKIFTFLTIFSYNYRVTFTIDDICDFEVTLGMHGIHNRFTKFLKGTYLYEFRTFLRITCYNT